MNWSEDPETSVDWADEEGSLTRITYSEDFGNTWTVIDITEDGIEDIDWPFYDYLWVIDGNNEIHLSKDQGTTWIHLTGWRLLWHKITLHYWTIRLRLRYGNKIKYRMDKAFMESLGGLFQSLPRLQELLHVSRAESLRKRSERDQEDETTDL